MSTTIPVALLFFRVIAEPSGRPAALLLDVGAGDEALLAAELAAAGNDDHCLSSLQDAMPGFYRAERIADPALQQVLRAAGWQPLAPGTLCRVDQRLVADFLPAGTEWVDGNWCMAPPSTATGAQAASKVTALQMVQLVARDADTHEIEALLRRDPTLSYNLLRLVNSLGVGGGRRITSFSQALLLLGRQQLRRWLNLMLFAARQGDVRSGMPLAEVLAPLALGEAVMAALLQRDGELGALLALVEAAELGDMDGVAARLEQLQIAGSDFNQAICDAAGWMQGALRESQAAHG